MSFIPVFESEHKLKWASDRESTTFVFSINKGAKRKIAAMKKKTAETCHF